MKHRCTAYSWNRPFHMPHQQSNQIRPFMGTFLLYPVHRKYIRILKDYVDKNSSLILIGSDIEGFKNIIRITTKKGERHRRLYRLTLLAINRQTSDIKETDIKGVIGYPEIRIIKKTLAEAERKSILVTILSTILWYCKKR